VPLWSSQAKSCSGTACASAASRICARTEAVSMLAVASATVKETATGFATVASGAGANVTRKGSE
jgi:hypothetical protein